MADNSTYRSVDEKMADLATAESISRRNESQEAIIRELAMKHGDRYAEELEAATQRNMQAAQVVNDLLAAPYMVDRSGTRVDFTDSMGNYAPNADVANTGGIGVDASSSTSDGSQAMTVQDVDLGPANVGITAANQPIGETGEDGRLVSADMPTTTRTDVVRSSTRGARVEGEQAKMLAGPASGTRTNEAAPLSQEESKERAPELGPTAQTQERSGATVSPDRTGVSIEPVDAAEPQPKARQAAPRQTPKDMSTGEAAKAEAPKPEGDDK